MIFNLDAPTPVNLSVPEVKTVSITNGDYYVALDGNDVVAVNRVQTLPARHRSKGSVFRHNNVYRFGLLLTDIAGLRLSFTQELSCAIKRP